MEAVTVTTGIYSHQAAYGTFDGVLPMLPRNDHGPFSFHGQTALFSFPNPEPGTDSVRFPKHAVKSHSTTPVESVTWKYWYEEINGG
jgi:hypothetical protein